MTTAASPRDHAIWDAVTRVLRAHADALHAEGLIGGEPRDRAQAALERIAPAPASFETLMDAIGTVEEALERDAGDETAATLRVGRSAIETAVTVARMRCRDVLLDIDEAAAELQAAALDLAGAHVVTMMPLSIDAGIAQPVTVAHWLGLVLGELERGQIALSTAWDEVNRSPLGGGAGAGLSIPLDRERLAKRLGFDGPVESTLDAVSAVDWLAAVAAGLRRVVAPVERLTRELETWRRVEPGAFRMMEDAVETAPDLPQWAGSSAIVTSRTAAARALEGATALERVALSQPYGPLSAALDELLQLADAATAEAVAALRAGEELLARRIEINRAVLANRAGRALSTSSDLALFLMLEEQVDPASAERVAALTARRAREEGLEASAITQAMIDSAALMAMGQELKVEFEAISRYLAPRRLIERRTALGGPAPAATRDLLDRFRARAEEMSARREERRLQIAGEPMPDTPGGSGYA